MTERPSGDALDHKLRSATRAIVQPTPSPPDYEALEARDPSIWVIRATTRAKVLLAAASVILIIGGVAGYLIASNGGSEAEIVVTNDTRDVPDDTPQPDGQPSVSVSDLAWVEVPLDIPTFEDSLLFVTAASDTMVVVGGSSGDNAAIWTSTDRFTWARVPHDETTFGGDGQLTVEAIVPWGGGFVAVGEVSFDDGEDPRSRLVVWRSEDGLEWQRIPNNDDVFGGAGSQNGVSLAASGSRLVIIGRDVELQSSSALDNAVWTSSDGITWQQDSPFGRGSVDSVGVSPGGFLAVGDDDGSAVTWESSDGSLWERVPNSQGIGQGHTFAVTSTDLGWVTIGAVDEAPAAWTSVDGINWTQAVLDHPTETRINPSWSVSASRSGLAAVGFHDQGEFASTILISSDGTSWRAAVTAAALGETALGSITGFGSHFVAVGQNRSSGAALWVTDLVGTAEVTSESNSPASKTDDRPEPPAASSTSINWSRIEDVAPIEVVSDGQTFFALVERGTETQLLSSTNGTSWVPVATVPFDHIDSTSNGKVLSVKYERLRAGGSSEHRITAHLVEADGTVAQRSTALLIPDRHKPFIEGISVSATFLPMEGVVVTGSYSISHAAVVASAIGIPLQDITDADFGDGLERLLADAGVDMFGPGSLTDTEVSVDGAVATLEDFGLTGQELFGEIAVSLVSSDGLEWEQVDVPEGFFFGYRPISIEGAIIGGVYDGNFRETISVSEDGVEWNAVVDLATGFPITRDGRLLDSAGSGEAIYLSGNRAWRVTVDGATELPTEGTEFESIDNSIENSGGSMAVGDAGIAYLTGFSGGAPQEPYGPTAIVVSTDYETWTRLSLPSELVGPEGEIVAYRLSVGAGGVVLWNHGAAWFGELNTATRG